MGFFLGNGEKSKNSKVKSKKGVVLFNRFKMFKMLIFEGTNPIELIEHIEPLKLPIAKKSSSY
jgi:hypothetical protein